MVAYVVQALQGCRAVKRLAVAGSKEELDGILPPEVLLVSSGENLIATLENALAEYSPREWLLVATADAPLITTQAVEDFLGRCEPLLSRYNFFYSVVREETYQTFCPGSRRTYARLREASLTGGNLFLVRPEIAIPACRRGQEIMRLRKSPLRMARLIGPWFLLRFLLRRLPLAEAEERFSALLGLKGITVSVPYPEVAFDLDHPEDFALAEKLLAERNRATSSQR
jgi:GTP:adenosylcobinamide-phosphate guanylyltransferase